MLPSPAGPNASGGTLQPRSPDLASRIVRSSPSGVTLGAGLRVLQSPPAGSIYSPTPESAAPDLSRLRKGPRRDRGQGRGAPHPRPQELRCNVEARPAALDRKAAPLLDDLSRTRLAEDPRCPPPRAAALQVTTSTPSSPSGPRSPATATSPTTTRSWAASPRCPPSSSSATRKATPPALVIALGTSAWPPEGYRKAIRLMLRRPLRPGRHPSTRPAPTRQGRRGARPRRGHRPLDRDLQPRLPVVSVTRSADD